MAAWQGMHHVSQYLRFRMVMDLFNFNTLEFFSFLLTLMRISLVVFLLPVYGGKSAPAQVKAAMCLVLTLALFPALKLEGGAMPAHPLMLGTILISELILGLVLGLMVRFVFAGIQTGGEIIGFQMGFTMISVADPMTGSNVSVTSSLLYMVALLTFMTLNGHLYLLQAVADTFTLIPPGGLVLSAKLGKTVFAMSAQMFVLAVKIAAPVMAVLLLVELALALMGRAAPEMNLLTLGFPLKIAVGFYFLGLLFTIMADHMRLLIIDLVPMAQTLINAASPFSQ